MKITAFKVRIISITTAMCNNSNTVHRIDFLVLPVFGKSSEFLIGTADPAKKATLAELREKVVNL